MSYLAQRLTKEYISRLNSKKSITMGLVKFQTWKTANFNKICYICQKNSIMAASGHIFDNHNSSIECSIQCHKFKEVFIQRLADVFGLIYGPDTS